MAQSRLLAGRLGPLVQVYRHVGGLDRRLGIDSRVGAGRLVALGNIKHNRLQVVRVVVGEDDRDGAGR